MERVVLDPAVLVSALITPAGPPATLWRAVLDRRLETVVCPRLLAELAGVLERPKFRRYVTVDEARAFVAEVAESGRALADPVNPPRASRDADDDYLVALALTAGVRALVSGDRDLTDGRSRPARPHAGASRSGVVALRRRRRTTQTKLGPQTGGQQGVTGVPAGQQTLLATCAVVR